MPLIIPGNLSGGVIYSQNFSNNDVTLASASESKNQTQASSQKPANQQIQSQANTGAIGGIQALHSTESLLGFHSDIADFNIIPKREGSVSSTAGIQIEGAGQASAQGNGINGLAQLADAVMAGPSITVNSPPTNYPLTTQPFDVDLSDSTTAQTNRAQQVSQTLQAGKKKDKTQAQLKVSVSPQAGVYNAYGLQQALLGGYAPTGATDPLTNTAPGTTDFAIASKLQSAQNVAFNTAGNTLSQIQSKRKPSGIQAGTGLGFATQAAARNSSFSFISIA